MSPINKHIGKRIKKRRIELGLSQRSLGDRMGITFQQVQKYENGLNGVSTERLFQMAENLKIPVIYFFVGLDEKAVHKLPCESSDRETLELVKGFNRIADKLTRQRISNLVRAISV